MELKRQGIPRELRRQINQLAHVAAQHQALAIRTRIVNELDTLVAAGASLGELQSKLEKMAQALKGE